MHQIASNLRLEVANARGRDPLASPPWRMHGAMRKKAPGALLRCLPYCYLVSLLRCKLKVAFPGKPCLNAASQVCVRGLRKSSPSFFWCPFAEETP